MKAVILAGGQGQRLRPLTARIPKLLMPMGEYTLLEVLLRQLARAGVDEVILCVHHQAALIQALIGTGERYGLHVLYRYEETPLGTVGPVRSCLADLPEHFLVMNGDILCDLNFGDLYRTGVTSGALLTVAVREQILKVDFGVVTMDAEARVRSFQEKPSYSYWVNMGVYAMAREALQLVPEGQVFGMDDLMDKLLQASLPIDAYPFRGRWMDIGQSEDLALAQREFDTNLEHYLPE